MEGEWFMDKEVSISKKNYYITSAIISLIFAIIFSFMVAGIMNNANLTNGNSVFSTAIIFLPAIFVFFETYSLTLIVVLEKISKK